MLPRLRIADEVISRSVAVFDENMCPRRCVHCIGVCYFFREMHTHTHMPLPPRTLSVMYHAHPSTHARTLGPWIGSAYTHARPHIRASQRHLNANNVDHRNRSATLSLPNTMFPANF